MLQSLLQPRDNHRPMMIGAMPAVAVRHERRRGEKRGGGRRPSQLPLQLGRPGECEPTPSPDYTGFSYDLYVCAKVAALHAVVGSLLLGIVVLIVGLVQLSPGAEAAKHRYYLIVSGAGLVGIGILGAVLRCLCLHYFNREYGEEETPRTDSVPQKNGVSVVVESAQGQAHDGNKGHGAEPKVHKVKTKLRAQPSRDQGSADLVKQPSTDI